MSAGARAAQSVSEQVVLANKEFYRQIASKYDHYEYCASDAFFQGLIEEDLNIIEQGLSTHRGDVRCLDCGGGTGNATLKMLRRGWNVTVVDVSSDMLDILREKARAAGKTAVFINDSIENYLASSQECFDVVSFSSVLHHLYAPVTVAARAAVRIDPGGFFYSVFDPVPPSSGFAAALFGSLDTLLAKVIYDRRDLLPGFMRRLKKMRTPENPENGRAVVSAGDLAEYHARKGIDDIQLAQMLERCGFEVDRRRYPVGRTKLTRLLDSYLKVLLNFRILARRADKLPCH